MFWWFSSRSPGISSSFSSNQSWYLQDTGPKESTAEERTASMKTVQFSARSSELCSSASKRLQIPLIYACLFLSCFSLETPNLFSHFLAFRSPYRLNALVEFADNKPVIYPIICTTQSFLSF